MSKSNSVVAYNPANVNPPGILPDGPSKTDLKIATPTPAPVKPGVNSNQLPPSSTGNGKLFDDFQSDVSRVSKVGDSRILELEDGTSLVLKQEDRLQATRYDAKGVKVWSAFQRGDGTVAQIVFKNGEMEKMTNLPLPIDDLKKSLEQFFKLPLGPVNPSATPAQGDPNNQLRTKNSATPSDQQTVQVTEKTKSNPAGETVRPEVADALKLVEQGKTELKEVQVTEEKLGPFSKEELAKVTSDKEKYRQQVADLQKRNLELMEESRRIEPSLSLAGSRDNQKIYESMLALGKQMDGLLAEMEQTTDPAKLKVIAAKLERASKALEAMSKALRAITSAIA
jgi:hypothetical protein